MSGSSCRILYGRTQRKSRPLFKSAPLLTCAPGHSPCCVPLKSWLQCRYVSTLRTPFMATTKLSSREFNQDTSRAKRAAKRGPVFITDRGRPSHVLLTVEEYQKLTEGQKSIVDLLGMPQAAEIEFEPPRMKGNLHQPADLS